jgi:bifunctional non-homologous end joining protein LigD
MATACKPAYTTGASGCTPARGSIGPNRYPTTAADVGRLPASKLVIDGEVISADAQGRSNFSTLQDDLKQRRYDRMVYYAFGLLHLDGFDTRAAPLIERKRVLQSGLEGIVSKRADAPYRSGSGPSSKCSL